MNETLRAHVRRLRHPERLKGDVGAVVTWGACDDPIKIIGKSLGLHEGHAAATRAAIEVRQTRPDTVQRCHRRLALHGRFMDGSIAEINQLFRVTDCETGISAGVARVRGSSSIPASERIASRATFSSSCVGAMVSSP